MKRVYSLITCPAILILLLMVFTPHLVHSQVVSKSTAKKWRSDLEQMREQLHERHVNLYHKISREDFDMAVKELDEDIASLTEPQILVRIAQLVARIGDGHTSFFPGNQKNKWFRFYPIKLWTFSDGIYVIGATEEHRFLLGKRLVRIDETAIDTAFELVSTTIGADNDMEHIYTVPFDLCRAEMLEVLGISNSSKQAEFVFDDGTRAVLKSISLKPWQNAEWYSANSLFNGERPPSMRVDFLFATKLTYPFIQQRRYYWFTPIEEQNAIYLQYNVCWDQKNQPSFAEMIKDMFAYLDEHKIERLIIDVRQNSGGEPATAQSLLDELQKRKKFVEEGRLFVLTGRRTFSAALTNAAALRAQANARIVGEAPRGKPNNPSEGRDIDLKKVNIWLTVSTQFVERDKGLGNAPFLPVEIKVPMRFTDYINSKDAVLEAALKAKLWK